MRPFDLTLGTSTAEVPSGQQMSLMLPQICATDSSTLALRRPLPAHQGEAGVNVAAI